MKPYLYLKLLAVGFLSSAGFLTLNGCASYPDAIAVDDPKTLPSFEAVKNQPQTYESEYLVFGGKVIQTTNQDGSSTLEILQFPLWESGKPRTDKDNTQGRFKARLDNFLDPELYANGRFVTVRGRLQGFEDGTIGEHNYRYLVLAADGLYLWPEMTDEERARISTFSSFHHSWPYAYYPRTRIIVTQSASSE